MSGTDLPRLVWRGLATWLLLSLLGWFWAQPLLGWFIPYIEWIIGLAANAYRAHVSLNGAGAEANLELQMVLQQPLALSAQQTLKPGIKLTVVHHVLHDLAPLIVEFSLLLIWPVVSLRQRLLLLLAGIPAAFAVLGLTTPFVLLGLLEIQLQQIALYYHFIRPEPWILQWLYFCEMGGNWLLAISAALLCVRLIHVTRPSA
ncbi:hypothetical protein KEF85_03025 [Methylomonas paludis]|uniref:Uncharacterized protein n=1 Tax=Methylomonas paludis TaxID=1173101 RepID=A0A975MQ79_9GAMM|nr:hypothetical protein [Methylomonas paludis]QWF71469.1 hypothetical protein KEF85_03025 [Methylomonas paludis]